MLKKRAYKIVAESEISRQRMYANSSNFLTVVVELAQKFVNHISGEADKEFPLSILHYIQKPGIHFYIFN